MTTRMRSLASTRSTTSRSTRCSESWRRNTDSRRRAYCLKLPLRLPAVRAPVPMLPLSLNLPDDATLGFAVETMQAPTENRLSRLTRTEALTLISSRTGPGHTDLDSTNGESTSTRVANGMAHPAPTTMGRPTTTLQVCRRQGHLDSSIPVR
jgi:hypothetical protein